MGSPDIREAFIRFVNFHGVDVDTLSREFRCVDREGLHEGRAVTLLRVFRPSEVKKKESL